MENTKVSAFNPIGAISQYRQYFSLLGVLLFGAMTGINCVGNAAISTEEQTVSSQNNHQIKKLTPASGTQQINTNEEYEVMLSKNEFYYISNGVLKDDQGSVQNLNNSVMIAEKSGIYTFKLDGSASVKTASVTFDQLPVVQDNISFSSQGVNKIFTRQYDRKVYRYEADLTKDKEYAIRFSGDYRDTPTFMLRITDAAGQEVPLTQQYDIFKFVAPQGGKYQVSIHPFYGNYSDRELNFIEKITANFNLTINQTASSVLQNPGDEHLYKVSLQPNKKYALMSTNGYPPFSTQNNTLIDMGVPYNYPSGTKIISVSQPDKLSLSFYNPSARTPRSYQFTLLEINTQDINLSPSVTGTKVENTLNMNTAEHKIRFNTLPGKTYVVAAKKTNNNATDLIVINDKVDQLFEKVTATGTSLEYTVRLFNPGIAADYVFEVFEAITPSDAVQNIAIQPGTTKSFYMVGNAQDSLQFIYQDGISTPESTSGVLKSALVVTGEQVVLWYVPITYNGTTTQVAVYGEKYIFGNYMGSYGKNYTNIVLEDGKLYRYDLRNDLANTVNATVTIKK